MEETAKTELENQVTLYQFYVSTYTKGIALYLAITGALLKFAIDSKEYRQVFGAAGLLSAIAILIVLGFGIAWERITAKEFRRLAVTTGTTCISTAPFRALTVAVAAFWVLVFIGWFYILFWLE
jgi:hypothetical protein